MRTLFSSALLLLLSLGTAAVSKADPVVVGGKWYEFLFGAAGSFATACPSSTCGPSPTGNSIFAGDPPWTFTLGAEGGTLTVTDASFIGDSFNIFDFGVLIGMTPTVAAVGDCDSDPVPCLANPQVSHGVFSLGPGAHSITIQVRDSPFRFGAAYFRADSPIPEPTTLLLLATGLAGVATKFGRRRRARKE
jgi:hypothetical protein